MRARRLLLPVLSCAALLAPGVARAQGITYAGCQPAPFECATLTVPLDRSGALPGTVTLAVKRATASSNPEHKALLTLAGGPGQAAVPLAEDFARVMGAGLSDRDLLVFDQRGTGSSGPLQCTALLAGHSSGSIVTDAQRCAEQLGQARGVYTTAQSVDDIEGIRQASGYDKLTIYGVSYGTKVALAYAARYPDHVDGLILDSVVRPDGPDPFHRSTFAATRRVLDELCSGGGCKGITSDPAGELGRIVTRLARRSMTGRVVDGRGHHIRFGMNDLDLLQIALAGDVNPTLRAELPGSVHSALHGDRTPLLRLAARAEGLNEINGLQATGGGDSDALFAATRCEETPFPWDRSADAATRARQATAAANGLDAASLRPFNRSIALEGELIPLCVGWPVASPAPAAPGPLPPVPTLVLEGQADLRTPLEDGQVVAAQIPEGKATVVAIPHTGHSVLGSDLSSCGTDAVTAFFTGRQPSPCAPTRNLFFPTPVAPTKLARVHGRNRTLKTVAAVAETLDDVRRHFIGDEIAAGHAPRSGSRVGGLRSGYARYTSSGLVLKRIAYVPRIQVSGLYRLADKSTSTVTVSGRGAPRGRITFHGDGRVTGRLGHRRLKLKASAARVTARRDWPLRLPPFPALRDG